MQEEPLAEAAEELRVDGVYVDPEVSDLVEDEDALAGLVEDASTPIFVAVVPEGSGGRPQQLQTLRELTDRPGTYLVVDDEGFTAGSDFIDGASQLASEIANDATDPNDAITEFVTGVADEA